jgi:taurine transport system permease protein
MKNPDDPLVVPVVTNKHAWVGRRQIVLLIKVASVVAFISIWSLSTELGWISTLFLPTPASVYGQAERLIANGDLMWAILDSSRRVFLGFILAAVFAVPMGILMGVWWPAKAIFDPFVSLLRPLPSITWIPLSILWLGIGEAQKVAIVFMGSWVYILLYTLESTKRVDPMTIRAARNLGASDFVLMREVVFPGALPGILAGLKVTLAISWSCVISAEMVAAPNGLGALIWQAKDWGNMQLVLVGMVGISLTVLVADLLMERIERFLLPWERSRRDA